MAKRPGLLRVNRMFLALARELLGRGCVIYVVHAAMVGLKQAGKHNWRPDVLAQEGMRSGGTFAQGGRLACLDDRLVLALVRERSNSELPGTCRLPPHPQSDGDTAHANSESPCRCGDTAHAIATAASAH